MPKCSCGRRKVQLKTVTTCLHCDTAEAGSVYRWGAPNLPGTDHGLLDPSRIK